MVSHDGAVAHWHWPKVGIHTQASADEHVDVPSAHAASEVRSPHGPPFGGHDHNERQHDQRNEGADGNPTIDII